jgi:hypothetical protein
LHAALSDSTFDETRFWHTYPLVIQLSGLSPPNKVLCLSQSILLATRSLALQSKGSKMRTARKSGHEEFKVA